MYHLVTISDLKIIKSYKTYKGASRAQDKLMFKDRDLYFSTAILVDDRLKKLRSFWKNSLRTGKAIVIWKKTLRVADGQKSLPIHYPESGKNVWKGNRIKF